MARERRRREQLNLVSAVLNIRRHALNNDVLKAVGNAPQPITLLLLTYSTYYNPKPDGISLCRMIHVAPLPDFSLPRCSERIS